MKIFVYILATYILALNFVPCNDAFTSSNEDYTTIASQLSQDSHEHGTVDYCTPFCQCNCCQIHIADFEIYSPELFITDDFNLHQFTHFDNIGKELTTSLFQPPRV